MTITANTNYSKIIDMKKRPNIGWDNSGNVKNGFFILDEGKKLFTWSQKCLFDKKSPRKSCKIPRRPKEWA